MASSRGTSVYANHLRSSIKQSACRTTLFQLEPSKGNNNNGDFFEERYKSERGLSTSSHKVVANSMLKTISIGVLIALSGAIIAEGKPVLIKVFAPSGGILFAVWGKLQTLVLLLSPQATPVPVTKIQWEHRLSPVSLSLVLSHQKFNC